MRNGAPAKEAAAILCAAKALEPRIRELAPAVRAERRLPKDLVEDLRATGVFRMAMPKDWGGPELPVLDQLEILEALAYADGSVGWCAMIGCDSGYYSAFLDDGVARALYPDLDLVTAGLAQPAGKAVRADGGWRVSGRWTFGSGCTHADRIVGGCFLHEGDAMITNQSGMPEWRTIFLPIDEVEIHDTWYTTGLEGSGSNDYSAADVFAPDQHAVYILGPTRRDGALYGLPWWFIVKVAAVPLGLARRAVDELIEVADTKLVLPEFTLLRDQGRTQAAVARATALTGAARAWLTDVIGDTWDTLASGREVTPRQLGTLRLAMIHTADACRQAITLLYDTAATSAIFATNPLDQIFRDMTTIAQHMVLQPKNYEPVGRRLMGMEPGAPMM